MTDVELRPARPADLGSVADLWAAGWPDGHLGNVPDELVRVRTPEFFRERTAHRLGQTTVAVTGGEVAGFVVVVSDEVEQVYVAAAHRGSGIAAVLLAEAERQVAANGHLRARLAVVPGNDRAQRFYRRSGWSDDGPADFPAPGPDGPVTVPVRRYVKWVAPGGEES